MFSLIDGPVRGTKLLIMSRLCLPHSAERTARLVLVVLVCFGCERANSIPRSDSSTVQVPSASVVTRAQEAENDWLPEIGPVLLIEAASAEEAIVLAPVAGDLLSARLAKLAADSTTITLLGRGGSQMAARLGSEGEKISAECTTWPIRNAQGRNSGGPWSIGFANRDVQPLAMDSVELLSPHDSMALVAEVSRLASTVSAPSDPAFQGLRFTAHDIRRFEAAPGVSALVAHVIRRVNQEANPQEEQTLLIAERDSGAVSGLYHVVYAERTSGLEERVTTPEVIGAALLQGRATLVVARDNENGVSYVLIVRAGGSHWRLRWTSAPTICN